jgi:hypothetical protein
VSHGLRHKFSLNTKEQQQKKYGRRKDVEAKFPLHFDLTLILTALSAARGGKDPLLPHPFHTAQPCGGVGGFLWSPEDLFNKNFNYHQKHIENDVFNENLCNTKSFLRYFARQF